VAWNTASGQIKATACSKSTGVEIYRNAYPSGTFSACFDSSCVDQNTGFVKYGTTTPPACVATTEVCDGKDNDCDGQTDEGNICAVPADVSKLVPSSQPAGTKIGDYMEGTGCRKLVYSTSAGWIESRVCPKNGKYEMYLLTSPGIANICIGSSCVGAAGGFVTFG
jgi:hypothetical protein